MEADEDLAPRKIEVSTPDETGQQIEIEEPFVGQPKVLPGFSETFKRASRAHEVLTNEEARRQYDISLTGSSEDVEWAADIVKEARAQLAKHRAQQQVEAQKSVQKLPPAVVQLNNPRQAMRRQALTDLRSSEAEVILQHVAKGMPAAILAVGHVGAGHLEGPIPRAANVGIG